MESVENHFQKSAYTYMFYMKFQDYKPSRKFVFPDLDLHIRNGHSQLLQSLMQVKFVQLPNFNLMRPLTVVK